MEDKALTPSIVTTSPNSGLSVFLDANAFNQLYRAAKLFASSDLVPSSYKGKEANCFIALELSSRMGVPAFAVMQNVSIINGKPGMEAKLIIAMINNSNLFEDPLDYEIVGDDPSWNKTKSLPTDPKYKVRAFATRKKTGKTCYGPWITWDMAIAENWVSKGQSKWQTMAGIMFQYRAASFFGKLYCPDLMFGMQSSEELTDITPDNYSTPKASRAAAIMDKFIEAAPEPTGDLPMTAEEVAEVAHGIEAQEELLQEVYALLGAVAERKETTPDDLIDELTKGKLSIQTDLAEKAPAYIYDIKLILEGML